MASTATRALCSVSIRATCRPSGTCPCTSSQLGPEPGTRRPGRAGAEHLLGDAADRADRAVGADLAGAGDLLAAGEVARREHVDDAEGEHRAGAGTADVVDLDLDRERERESGPIPSIVRPSALVVVSGKVDLLAVQPHLHA